MDRNEKSDFVEKLGAVFASANVVVVAHYAGLNVADMTSLRAKAREVGASAKVVKNRLAKLALKGTEAEPIAELFVGPTMIAYSSDPVAAPKAMVDFAKAHEKLVVLGGAMGQTTLDADGVKALASLPSLDELRAKIVGMISTPATRIARMVNAPAGQVARVIGAFAEKDKAA